VAEDVGIGFLGADGPASYGDSFGLAAGEADEFDDGFGEFVGGVGFDGFTMEVFGRDIGIFIPEVCSVHFVEDMDGGWHFF